jgi:diguanylate cyclase (GGDEF)-like protein
VESTRERRLRGVSLLALAYSAAYLAVLGLATGSRAAIVVDDLGNLLSPLIAALACLLAARRCTGRLRTSWHLLSAYAATWALGQLAWVWYEVVRDVPVPFPGLPDVGYVASVVFVLGALLAHPDAPRLTSGALRLTIDAVLVGASLLALSWRLALGDAYRSMGAHGLAQVLGLAYPVLDVIVLTVLLLVAIRPRTGLGRPFLLVAGCLAAGAVGHVVYGVLAQNGTWQPGNPVDAAWGVGFLLLALGAHAETGRQRPRRRPRLVSLRSSALPFVPLLGLISVAAYDDAHGIAVDHLSRGLGYAVFLSVLLRQGLALMENGRLTRGLEETVVERTLELSRTMERLQRQAWTDALTGLPNRARLFESISEALPRGTLTVALLDLDGFKSVNDSLGHDTGDQLLHHVGRRLARDLPPEVMAARLGGDEFAFLLPGCSTEAHARDFGAQVLRALTGPVELVGRTLTLTGSVGLVISVPEDTPESLLRNADVAMYAAKDSGKNTFCMFEEPMREKLLTRVGLEADLRVALLAGDVVPWFQPVVDLSTGELTGVEALARWPKDGTMVSPGVFVPLAEQSGLVGLLGRQILRASCAHAAEWNRYGDLTLSVNLSAVQLASEDLVDQVREALNDTGLSPERLVLEITETVLMEDALAVGPRLEALRALGVRIALDDFGTGYSALGYLRKIPVDIVKIDRMFVADIHLGARQGALAAAVMTLAEALDLDVVAEGIELPEQAARLREIGCRLGQGFLYNPALPPEELTELWFEQVGNSDQAAVSF